MKTISTIPTPELQPSGVDTAALCAQRESWWAFTRLGSKVMII